MKICTISSCEKLVHARGICNMHYLRWKKEAGPLSKTGTIREENGNWKGAEAKYEAIHVSARKYWLKDACEHCGESERMLHMANLSGQYLRVETDWKTLCVPCHHRLDEKSYRNIQKPGKSGHTGVQQRERGMWRSRLNVNCFRVHLGDFQNIEDAIMMRLAAEEQLL